MNYLLDQTLIKDCALILSVLMLSHRKPTISFINYWI